jgi:hypothetical protein
MFRICGKTWLSLECELRFRSSVSAKLAASSKLIDTGMLISISVVRIFHYFGLQFISFFVSALPLRIENKFIKQEI